VLRREHVQNRFHFKIKEDTIPAVQGKSVETLGNWYRVDLNDEQSVMEMFKEVETWMTSLEKSGLPGKYKAWGIPT